GNMYAEGKGVEQDYHQAFLLYEASAEQGDVGGQYALGYAYKHGLGVGKDRKQAKKWYKTGRNSEWLQMIGR
ncbi:MAG: sel1 repeat family protein, partial [Peptostreptococcaceae bacterium]|nr:sel1 repeat family protein [Peptostreptococcaceae bacterium]